MPDSDGWPQRDQREPPGLLQTADRTLQVLLAFDRDRADWGVTEVSREFGWDKSVAQRILATLAYRGFLVADPATRRYRIGPATIQLARVWQQSRSLELLVQPVLEELTRRTGDSSLLCVPDGFHVRCVAAADGPSGPLRYYPLVGELYPAHAGATSKAYFAFLPPQERNRLFTDRPLARFTDQTPVDPTRLAEEFSAIRDRGYALSEGEYDGDTAALAVPVHVRRELYGSLSLGWRSGRSDDDASTRLPLLWDAASVIDDILGGSGRRR
ncbi:IclR family transcriptional regulator [Marinitenerispora sediminis]|uniref:IclR family transcriptional regulator n=1 Tax=Marinitenerispora sediminis TaxID=1931232 RepID=A0A368TCK9_9ACTN|nr:IclR family transcriptional regulator [Marinitenerispora sediminis]RCV59868.1 IclR family transcriptional regulator [Marinitenerispora sediminis]RCV61194.1 IclR family transcriptional regulator [Marinitenerispora sediminis]